MDTGRRYYDTSPVWLQTVAVQIAGLGTYRRKYGPEFHRFAAALTANERLSRDESLGQQARALRAMLIHAKGRVPFYRAHPCSPDDLATWPVISRSDIAREPHRFLADGFDARRLMHSHTSGTSGTPLAILFPVGTYQREMAFRWRHKAWAKIGFRSRGAYIAGHAVVPAAQREAPFWRTDLAENRLLMSSYHMNSDTLPRYLRAIGSFRPEFIHGYPSSLYLLAVAARRTGIVPRVRAIFSASETLLTFQREAIEGVFGAKVYNWYGQTELTCNIIECPAGGLHVRPDYGVLEVDPDGSMICTGLNNPAMPLIRYRTADRVVPGEGDCSCGCAFPVVASVEGRIEDYIVTAEGFLVGRLDHLFKGCQGVLEAQIVQREVGAIVLRIVRGTSYSQGEEENIRREAVSRLGEQMRIEFEYVDRVERGPGGKFPFILRDAAISDAERSMGLADVHASLGTGAGAK